jgi:hypothetical protein
MQRMRSSHCSCLTKREEAGGTYWEAVGLQGAVEEGQIVLAEVLEIVAAAFPSPFLLAAAALRKTAAVAGAPEEALQKEAVLVDPWAGAVLVPCEEEAPVLQEPGE